MACTRVGCYCMYNDYDYDDEDNFLYNESFWDNDQFDVFLKTPAPSSTSTVPMPPSPSPAFLIDSQAPTNIDELVSDIMAAIDHHTDHHTDHHADDDEDEARELHDPFGDVSVHVKERKTKKDILTVAMATAAHKSSKNHKLKMRSKKRDVTKHTHAKEAAKAHRNSVTAKNISRA